MTETITITLNRITELFDEPESDPWNSSTSYRSGIDEIFVKLRAIPIREPVNLSILIPDESMTSDIEARTNEAIDRYCAAQIETNMYEIKAIKKEGRIDFIISVVSVLALFFAVGVFIQFLELDGVLLTALLGWTGIASWAILWGPVDTFIWGRLPLRRALGYYRKLMEMDVEVRGR